MQPFTCPQCGHQSSFDPLEGCAVCPECGYTPPLDRRVVAEPKEDGKKGGAEQSLRSAQGLRAAEGVLSPLDELLGHWDGTHVPSHGITVRTKREVLALFQLYQQALGETRHFRADRHPSYARSYRPETDAVQSFVGAYLALKRGERARATQMLQGLTQRYPQFPDPWIWLSATTDDQATRIDYLENAIVAEPAHPLAQEALAVAQGRVPRPEAGGRAREQPRVVQTKCHRCGGSLRYEPGEGAVSCPYCGHRQELERANVVDGEATLVGELQLRRRMQGQEWKEVRRVVHCQACGAELTMSRYLAKQCVFCGCSSVLAEDSSRAFVQPDGFLPFAVDKPQAVAAVEKTQRSAMGNLKTWWIGKQQELLGLEAVYLPFWIFDGIVEVRKAALGPMSSGSRWDLATGVRTLARYPGDSVAERLSAHVKNGDEEREAAVRKDLMVFDNLVYSALDFPPWWLLKQVLPFELRAVIAYESRLLADWPAALYQRDVEQVVEQAYNTMLAKAVWRHKSLALGQVVDFAELRRTFQVTTVTYQLVLLPVWAGLARREQEHRLVLVNGQTGSVVMSSPLRLT